jgi:hypothetical protein
MELASTLSAARSLLAADGIFATVKAEAEVEFIFAPHLFCVL